MSRVLHNFCKVGLAILISLTTIAVFAAQEKKFYPELKIIGTTNKSALSYAPGEEIVLTFRLNNTKNIPEGCCLYYNRKGDDGKSFRGKALASKGLIVKTSLPPPGVVYVKVYLTDAKGKVLRPATGYLIVPNDAKEKSLAVRIDFYGYGASAQRVPSMVVPGHLVLKLNAHGQKLGQTPEYYKEFFSSIKSGKYNYAFDPEQNIDPENCFFNGMVMRALRAMEYLKSPPEWNGKDLIASAKRIKKSEVNITHAGLGDYTCPPSGLAICHLNLETPPKSILEVNY